MSILGLNTPTGASNRRYIFLLCTGSVLLALLWLNPTGARAEEPSATWVETYSGSILREAKTFEFHGTVPAVEVGPNKFYCPVNGKATLTPGGTGEITSFTFEASKCGNSEGFKNCILESGGAVGKWPLTATEKGLVVSKFKIVAHFKSGVSGCTYIYGQNVESEATGDWVATLDNSKAISKITLSGEDYVYVPSGKITTWYNTNAMELSPLDAGMYGMTPFGKPGIVNKPAPTVVGPNSETLNATVYPEHSATTYQFEYGKTTSYGSKAPASPESIGSGFEGVKVSKVVEGLEPGVTYHYRVVATNGKGETKGPDGVFTTLGWSREGLGLTKSETIALSGQIIWENSGSGFECHGQGEATLNPGDKGEIGKFEIEPGTCVGVGLLWRECVGQSASTITAWPIQAIVEGGVRVIRISSLAFSLAMVKCKVGGTMSWEGKPGTIIATPDKASPFSSLQNKGTIVARVVNPGFTQNEAIGVLKGTWTVTPAGVFGIGS